jgi:phage gp37-like protein
MDSGENESMSLALFRDAIVAKIKTDLPTLRTCQAHGGRFDLGELSRWAMQSPAVIVSVLGGAVEREGGANVINTKVVAFVITPGSSVSHRDIAVMSIVDSLVAMVCQNSWNYEDAQAPQNMSAENLYSGDLDKTGVALWAVTWDQRLDVGILDEETLDDFKTNYVKWDLSPADGVMDAEDNIEPQGMFMTTQGNLHISTAVATAIGAISVYQKLAGTTELDVSTNVDMPFNNRLRYLGTITRPFIVDAAISISTAVDAKITIAIAKNGTVDTESEIEQNVTIAQGVAVFSVKNIVSLAHDDYVELWIKATQTGNVTATKAKFTIASA